MRVNNLASRLLVKLTTGVLIGIGCTVASADSIESNPNAQEQSSQTEFSIASEDSKTSVLSLAEIADIKSTSEQESELRKLLSNMDEDQVADLLAQSQDVFGESNRYALQLAMIQRLAQQNPRRALSLALEMDSNDNLRGFVTSIYKDWAHSNLDEAVARARTLSPFHKRIALRAIIQERTDLPTTTIDAIAQGLDNEQVVTSANAQQRIEGAIDDPETAWDELAIDLQDDLSNLRTLSRVATIWVEESGLEVLDRVYQSLTNTQTRQSVMYHVLEEVAQTDPAGALKYAMTLESDPHNYIIDNIANIWVRSDPRSALRVAAGIEQETARKALSESAVKALAFSEPREFLKEIDSLPADFQETAAKTALDEIARKSPEEAAELVASMQSGSAKTSSASSIVNTWSRSDHKAALDWILYEPGVEEIKFELLSSIMYTLVQVDLELAMSTALAQPIDEDKYFGLEFIVMLSLAESDVDQAIELFPQVREGPTQMLSFQPIVHSLLTNDEIDRAFDLVQQVPESDREGFYRALSNSWTVIDPQGMLNSMERFPSKQAKSQAGLLLVVGNEFTKILSNDQMEEAKKHLTEEDLQAFEEGDTEALRSIFQELGLLHVSQDHPEN